MCAQRGMMFLPSLWTNSGRSETLASMTEPAPAKRLLTRRLIIVGAMLLVLVLAVGGFGFKLFDGTSTPQLKISVMLIEPLPGQNITTAMITVSNSSSTRSWGALVGTNNYEGWPHHLPPDEYIDWRPQMVFTSDGPKIFMLAPLSTERSTVVLPVDGRVRKVAVHCFAQPRPLSRPLNKVREWWWTVRSWSPKFMLVESDQLIQCPRLLLDGTIEPPRVVTKEPR
jgi:hypothetical protein